LSVIARPLRREALQHDSAEGPPVEKCREEEGVENITYVVRLRVTNAGQVEACRTREVQRSRLGAAIIDRDDSIRRAEVDRHPPRR